MSNNQVLRLIFDYLTISDLCEMVSDSQIFHLIPYGNGILSYLKPILLINLNHIEIHC